MAKKKQEYPPKDYTASSKSHKKHPATIVAKKQKIEQKISFGDFIGKPASRKPRRTKKRRTRKEKTPRTKGERTKISLPEVDIDTNKIDFIGVILILLAIGLFVGSMFIKFRADTKFDFFSFILGIFALISLGSGIWRIVLRALPADQSERLRGKSKAGKERFENIPALTVVFSFLAIFMVAIIIMFFVAGINWLSILLIPVAIIFAYIAFRVSHMKDFSNNEKKAYKTREKRVFKIIFGILFFPLTIGILAYNQWIGRVEPVNKNKSKKTKTKSRRKSKKSQTEFSLYDKLFGDDS